MSTKIRVLMVEDVEDDAILIVHELRRGGYDPSFNRVDTVEDLVSALALQTWDIVLADYQMPHFTGLKALQVVRERDQDLPFIVVSSQIGEETAVDLMKSGAQDYVMKSKLQRLVPAVERELRDAENRRARKAAEEELRNNVELFRTLALVSPVGIFMSSVDGRTIYVNDRWCEIAGVSAERTLGAGWTKAIDAGDKGSVICGILPALKADVPYSSEMCLERADGTARWVLTQAMGVKDALGEVQSYIGTVTDITDLKVQAERLKRVNRALATLSKCSEVIMRAENEHQLLDDVCRAITNVGGYSLSWIGFSEMGAETNLRPVAHAGVDGDVLAALWDNEERECGPAAIAVRCKRTQVIECVAKSVQSERWKDIANQSGCDSSISLPLYYGSGAALGVVTIYERGTNAFAEQEIRVLEELASDLSFGMSTIHLRDERNRAQAESSKYQKKLRKSLEDALQALAATTEMRDPYTAGHQQRVAELAVCIAREMGLPEEQVHAIHLAGVVHDIGKINIPAEILAKPTTLTSIEFELIKTHSRSGYEILQGVEFPWPIADIVWQHHERLDGSGYPRGLKDKDILLETKIIAIADVVEAMSSHRPYRPGLGIEVALDEIERGRGRLYDERAVDACLKLFREQHFEFHNTTTLQRPLQAKMPG